MRLASQTVWICVACDFSWFRLVQKVFGFYSFVIRYSVFVIRLNINFFFLFSYSPLKFLYAVFFWALVQFHLDRNYCFDCCPIAVSIFRGFFVLSIFQRRNEVKLMCVSCYFVCVCFFFRAITVYSNIQLVSMIIR